MVGPYHKLGFYLTICIILAPVRIIGFLVTAPILDTLASITSLLSHLGGEQVHLFIG